jgi:hypothetical protein
MKNRGPIILFAIVTVMLMSLLSLPLGYDQAIFQIGGEMVIKHGAIPYRDFLEIKQPLIFYIYSAAIFLFGSHEWSIRLFDILYHLVTLFLFYKLLSKVYDDKRLPALSVFLYTCYYLGGGFWFTAQTESFAFLPSLLIVRGLYDFEQQISSSLRQRVLIAGKISLAVFILFMIKLTFIIALPGVLFFIFFLSNQTFVNKRSIVFLITGGCFVLLALGFFVYDVSGALPNFLLILDWSKHYADIMPLFAIETFKKIYFHLFPTNLLLSLSPTYFVLIVAGVVIGYISTKNPPEADCKRTIVFHSILLCFIGFGLIGVLIERKAFDYHFSRVAWMMMPFLAIAFLRYADKLHSLLNRNILTPQVLRNLSIHIPLIIILIIYSPISKIIYQPLDWTLIHFRHNADTLLRLKRLEMWGPGIKDAEHLENFLKSHLSASDEFFLWGVSVNIYPATGKLPPTFCMTTSQFMTSWTPPVWKQELLKQLDSTKPKYFICEIGDYRPLIVGTNNDSYASLVDWSDLRNFVSNNYNQVDSSAHFIVYERK